MGKEGGGGGRRGRRRKEGRMGVKLSCSDS